MSESVEPPTDRKVKKTIERDMKDFNARQLMAIAMIKTGMNREEVCKQTGITKAVYNSVLKKYQDSGLDKVTTEIMDNWEHVLRAKMMGATEKALDKTIHLMEFGEMKDAKMASGIFSEIFGTFRLSTGKSTENIETTTLRLTEMIESKTGLKKPNQSQYHESNSQIKEITA